MLISCILARSLRASPHTLPIAVGLLWGNLARDPPRHVVVAEVRSGTLGGGLDVVAVRGEAAPAPQAHRTAPYQPRYSLDQRTAD